MIKIIKLTVFLCLFCKFAHPLELSSSVLTSNSSVSFATSSSWERVVTDWNVIRSKDGVPLNFSYNETNVEGTDLIPSAPGCPKSFEGYPWNYFGNTSNKKCFLVGTQGPCPPGQLLFGNTTTGEGFCDCLCPEPVIKVKLNGNVSEIGLNGDSGPISKRSGNYRFCQYKELKEINAVFDIGNGSCYFLETQGPCQIKEWLVKDSSGFGLTCVPECSSVAGPLSQISFNFTTQACVKKENGSGKSQPVSLASNIGQRICEENAVYSKMLNKCISKSKAFFIQWEIN